MISPDELEILSFYRASELAGAMLLGKLALQTTNDRLRPQLTEQCAEEARHAWLFTKLITDLGATPSRMTRTYQSEVGKVFGLPESMLDVLCLTQVLEVEVLEHYIRHAQLPDVHPAVRETLEAIIDDERGHVDWVAAELDDYASRHGSAKVEAAMGRAKAASAAAFAELRQADPVRNYFGDALR
jgi:rubrerythrin